MRRTRHTSRARQSADAVTIIKLSKRLSESGTHIEDRLWQRRLIELLNERLARGLGDVIESALENLGQARNPAYEDLADLAESCAESITVEIDGKPHDALLVAIPLLAWSRYQLPTTSLAPALVDNIATQMAGHLAAHGTRITVADMLYSIDQLPESLDEVRKMTLALSEAMVAGKNLSVDVGTLREPLGILADSRYVLAMITAPQGHALYHWQETGVDPDAKTKALEAFCEQVQSVLAPVLTGCRYQVLAPNAFHAALRLADRELRAFSLEAALGFLKLAFDLPASRLQATVAAYEDKGVEEMRIGIGMVGNDDIVVEGIVWPLLGDDDEQAQEAIDAALRANGVVRITQHPHRFPIEYCDDCGAPMFPNPAGHSVHTEPPTDAEEVSPTPLH